MVIRTLAGLLAFVSAALAVLTTERSKLSHWSLEAKMEFLAAVSNTDCSNYTLGEWTVVMGNQAGDLDSLTSALAWAYHLSTSDPPVKAVALLQTSDDALELRPENLLALREARMRHGHSDLLTLDELPMKPFEIARRIKGIVLVDHAAPLGDWAAAEVLSIIDHHQDTGYAPNAKPRVLEVSASCSSLVVREIVKDRERQELARREQSAQVTFGGPSRFPDAVDLLAEELGELVLRAIAIDSSGLTSKKTMQVDKDTAALVFDKCCKPPNAEEPGLDRTMKAFDTALSAAKAELGDLTLRDLLRRDWKGDSVPSNCSDYPLIHLGFASVPVSLENQIRRTPEKTPPEWFAIERAWTSEVAADVTVVVTNYDDELPSSDTSLLGQEELEEEAEAFKGGRKKKDPHKEYASGRQIAVIVAHGPGQRLDADHADTLFHTIVDALESSDSFAKGLEVWHRPDGKELLPRRKIWRQKDSKGVGRKGVRPVVEKAVREWQGVPQKARSSSREL